MRPLATTIKIGLILVAVSLSAGDVRGVPDKKSTLELSVGDDFMPGYTMVAELRSRPDMLKENGHSGPVSTAGTVGPSCDLKDAETDKSSPPDEIAATATGRIAARRVGEMVAVDFRVNFTDPSPFEVIRRVGDGDYIRVWGVGDFSLIQDSDSGLFISLRDFDRVGYPREYTLVYRDSGQEVTLDQAKIELPEVPEVNMSAFPNPFNPRLEIKFTIPKPASTRLDIFDSRGQLVQSLVSGVKPAGEESVFWTGEDSRGRAVASGVYHLRLVVDQQRIVKTVTLLR